MDFILAPAHATDLTIGAERLREHTDIVVLGDKGSISQLLARELAQQNRLRLLTLPRRNESRQVPVALRRLLHAQRQISETMHDQLTEQFDISVNHAHSFGGLCTRLYTKLTAHTLSIYLNRLLGHVDFLHLKRLAFPN